MATTSSGASRSPSGSARSSRRTRSSPGGIGALRDELEEVRAELTEAARRVVAPVEAIHAAGDRTRERLEARPIGLGDVEQLGDDADRERVREVA
jgi:hypothetical protein